MSQIRKRLTYANVMSSIAVFLVLGGATAFAASTLGKNTVGSKQLKKNAVTGAKIKNGAVTGSKLKLSSIGKVPSAATADTATSAGTANTAKSAVTATTANTAITANTANTAGNANTVAGSTIRKFAYSVEENAPPQTVLSLDGLTLTASCVGGTPALNATTSTPGEALIRAGGTYLSATAFYVENDGFEAGETFEFLSEEVDSVQGTFSYLDESGAVVTGTFLSEENGLKECDIAGHAIG